MTLPLRAYVIKSFFQSIQNGHFNSIYDNIRNLLSFISMEDIFQRKDKIAVKISFGEWGNLNYIRPQFVKIFLEKVKAIGAVPFLTDTCTLYNGRRNNAIDHILNAIDNGFGFESLGVPVIIADGLKGNNFEEVEGGKKNFGKLKVASDIYYSDGMLK